MSSPADSPQGKKKMTPEELQRRREAKKIVFPRLPESPALRPKDGPPIDVQFAEAQYVSPGRGAVSLQTTCHEQLLDTCRIDGLPSSSSGAS